VISGSGGRFGGGESGVARCFGRLWHPAIETEKINFLRTSLCQITRADVQILLYCCAVADFKTAFAIHYRTVYK
jgi:hypothetical protein